MRRHKQWWASLLQVWLTALRGSGGLRPPFLALAGWLILSFIAPSPAVAQGTLPKDLQISIAQFDASAYPNITIYVNVKDSAGNFVTNLQKDVFKVTEDGQSVEIVEFAGIGEKRLVDIVYVFDTTGSMSEEIDGVIRTSKSFADELQSKGRDYRLGLVTFGDVVLQVYRSDNALTNSADEFKGWVSSLTASGGDDDPENDYGAIKRATEMQFRNEAQKIFILITDAPPHHYGDAADGGHAFDDPDLDNRRIIDMLKGKSISIYAVTPNYNEFTTLASETRGSFYDIKSNPNFTGIIEQIGSTIANQYRITYRSPRPTYDGTRRDVKITVGESGISTAYAEQHLLNVESNLLVGLLCMLPLLAAVVIPFGGQILLRSMRARTPAAEQVSQPGMGSAPAGGGPVGAAMPVEYMPPLPPAAPPAPAIPSGGYAPTPPPAAAAGCVACPNCGCALKPNARFCPACGQALPATLAPAPAAAVCPNCSRPLRAGAKFCNGCGYRLS
jgi:hypothetical protein